MLDLSKLLNVLKQNGRLSDGQDVPDEEQQTQQQRGTDAANSALSIIQPPQQTADATTGGQSVATGAQSIVRPPVQPDVPDTPPSIMRPPAQQMYDTALQKYNTIQNAPNPKVPKWANVLAIAGQTANDFFNNKSTPIESLGAIKKARNLAEAGGQLDVAGKQYQTQTNIDNINADNARMGEQMRLMHQDRQDRIGQQQSESDRKERDTRMRTVAGMFRALPSYNPNDPKFANLTQALGDVRLPVTPKDAKKNIKLAQDAETGAWTTILTDPVTQQQEVRPVMMGGKILTTTSPSKVMADAAGTRQEAGFGHQEKMLQLQDGYKKGFAEYQQTLKNADAARDAQTKSALMTQANQQKAALTALRTELHQIELQAKSEQP